MLWGILDRRQSVAPVPLHASGVVLQFASDGSQEGLAGLASREDVLEGMRRCNAVLRANFFVLSFWRQFLMMGMQLVAACLAVYLYGVRRLWAWIFVSLMLVVVLALQRRGRKLVEQAEREIKDILVQTFQAGKEGSIVDQVIVNCVYGIRKREFRALIFAVDRGLAAEDPFFVNPSLVRMLERRGEQQQILREVGRRWTTLEPVQRGAATEHRDAEEFASCDSGSTTQDAGAASLGGFANFAEST